MVMGRVRGFQSRIALTEGREGPADSLESQGERNTEGRLREGAPPIPLLRPFDGAHARAHLRQGERLSLSQKGVGVYASA